MNTRTLFVAFVLIAQVATLNASNEDVHSAKVYEPITPIGSSLPELVVTNNDRPFSISEQSYSAPIIVVRYLGFTCTHCVQQLTYLDSYRTQLRKLGISVYAFSGDDEETNRALVQRMNYDTTVMHVMSDVESRSARLIGAQRLDSGNDVDLHATLVVYKGQVHFVQLGLQPYMDVERVVAAAVAATGKTVEQVQATDVHPTDRYLTNSVTTTIVAGPTDGINQPMDLDFNHSPLNPNDLWVVTTSSGGNSIAILHRATSATERMIRLKKDSRASHFMWRTHGIAMGSNGTFATAQNGAPGNHNPFYQFMGPTLWSSDTAVFASRYQNENQVLASHLDMLHQSPQNLGIAHDVDNAFWVSDGYYNDITQYDFKDPHEVGGTDHRDGIIRRYPDARVSAGLLGEPGHIALDKTTGMLYIVDPGANIVTRLNTRTGSFVRDLSMPDASAENVAEYSEWKGAEVDTVISSGLGEPVGIEVDGNRLFVGDRVSGSIHVYRINGSSIEPMGSIATGAVELYGLCIGPDKRLWFVDHGASTVGRLDTESDATFVADLDVEVADNQTYVHFTYHSTASADTIHAAVAYVRSTTADGVGDWEPIDYSETVSVPQNGSGVFTVPFVLPDTVHVFEVEIREDLGDGAEGVSARAIIVPSSVRRAVVDDALMEGFRISEAVSQTDRTGYVSMRSDVFVRAAAQLTHLETVLWNAGSFGEISVTDDAVLNALLQRKVDVLLIGDDPFILRTDLPSPGAFYSRFGVQLKGVDRVSPDNGQRLYNGVVADPISATLGDVFLQLPRLDHYRGGYYVPNVCFVKSSDSARSVLVASDTTRILAIRNGVPDFRTVILGVNAARFRDGSSRTTFLDKALEWLEGATEVDTTTPTSVSETSHTNDFTLSVNGNVTSSTASVVVTGSNRTVDVGLYSVGGQRMATVYQGMVSGQQVLQANLSPYANGTYFVIARSADTVLYQTIVKQ